MVQKTEIARLDEAQRDLVKIDPKLIKSQEAGFLGSTDADLLFEGLGGSLHTPTAEVYRLEQAGATQVGRDGARYHRVSRFKGKDGAEVIIGTLGAGTWIVDPRTYSPVTPAFHDLLDLSNDGAVVAVGGSTWELKAQKLTPHRLTDVFDSAVDQTGLLYPSFLGAKQILAQRIDPDNKSAQVEPNVKTGLFDLAVEHNPQFEAANTTFNRVVENVFAYAKKDKRVLKQLRNPNIPIELPEIRNSKISARLSFVSKDDGTDIIQLSGTDQDDGTEGFMLVRKGDMITIVDGKLSFATSSDEQELFEETLISVDKALAEYFEGLKLKRSATALGAQSMHELRTKLGKTTSGRARKRINKGLEA